MQKYDTIEDLRRILEWDVNDYNITDLIFP